MVPQEYVDKNTLFLQKLEAMISEFSESNDSQKLYPIVEHQRSKVGKLIEQLAKYQNMMNISDGEMLIQSSNNRLNWEENNVSQHQHSKAYIDFQNKMKKREVNESEFWAFVFYLRLHVWIKCPSCHYTFSAPSNESPITITCPTCAWRAKIQGANIIHDYLIDNRCPFCEVFFKSHNTKARICDHCECSFIAWEYHICDCGKRIKVRIEPDITVCVCDIGWVLTKNGEIIKAHELIWVAIVRKDRTISQYPQQKSPPIASESFFFFKAIFCFLFPECSPESQTMRFDAVLVDP